MSKELILNLVLSGHGLELFLLLVGSFVALGLVVKLTHYFLKLKICPLRYHMIVLGLMFLRIGGKWIVPDGLILLISIVYIGLSCAGFHRIGFFKAIWFSMVSSAINLTGDLLVFIICMVHKPAFDFLIKNPYGLFLGILAGCIFPVIIMVRKGCKGLMYPIMDNKETVAIIFTNLGFIYLIYHTLFTFYINKMRFADFISLMIAILTAFGGFIFTMSMLKKRHELMLKCKEIEYLTVIDEAVEMEKKKPKLVTVKTPRELLPDLDGLFTESISLVNRLTEVRSKIQEHL